MFNFLKKQADDTEKDNYVVMSKEALEDVVRSIVYLANRTDDDDLVYSLVYADVVHFLNSSIEGCGEERPSITLMAYVESKFE